MTDPTVADALHLMMTLSDNAATAAIMELVGRDRIMARLADLGLTHTTVGAADVVADVQRISAGLDEYTRGAGFTGWAEPFDIVVAGRYDSIERRLARLPVDEISLPHDQLGPTTTARELGSLYAMVWRDEAGPPRACAAVSEAASDQQLKRLDTGAAGVTVAGKGGSIPGIINNDKAGYRAFYRLPEDASVVERTLRWVSTRTICSPRPRLEVGALRALCFNVPRPSLVRTVRNVVWWITAATNETARRVYDTHAAATPWVTYDMKPTIPAATP